MHLYQCRRIGRGRDEGGCRTTFRITFTHNFETWWFRRADLIPSFQRRLQLKRLHPIPVGRRNLSPLSLYLLSLFFLSSPDFNRSPIYIIGGRIAPAKTNVKLCVRPTVKVDERDVQSVGSHCAPLANISRKGTTSRSSDYATGRTSFGADRQNRPTPWASADRDRFSSRETIYDRIPRSISRRALSINIA